MLHVYLSVISPITSVEMHVRLIIFFLIEFIIVFYKIWNESNVTVS